MLMEKNQDTLEIVGEPGNLLEQSNKKNAEKLTRCPHEAESWLYDDEVGDGREAQNIKHEPTHKTWELTID